MAPRWGHSLFAIALGAQATLLASCEAVLGIHDPLPLVADAGSDGSTPLADAAPHPLEDRLVLLYGFDDDSSTVAIDSAAWQGIPRNATLVNAGTGAAFSNDRQVGTHSLELTAPDPAAGGYVTTLPAPGLRDLAPSAVSVALWMFVGENRMWQRAFDFGVAEATPTRYMFLTPNPPDRPPGTVRFVISRDGYAAEQAIEGAALSLNAWHHVTVVLSEGAPYTGRLYIDGALQGLNSNMTLHPGDLGATDQNFLGRSQFSPDPTFVGKLDDFRVYARALSEADIARLMKLR